ncbi:TIGR03620 family F420-dependent LLM class oxidoreductase [Fodinicola acaciae]|uniref:TIGR03620 family F420-dependent LLM class oxidoreductase n=1 Tax=Fodinicola acaciae TaxID=2681555 RepID=UPI0013D553AE|nr:TIGR03620 family F420-dependent LLM class oxidoreductase [Fodinicola acaciae]
MTSIVTETRQRMGKVGVFGSGVGSLAGISADGERRHAEAVERLGYGSLWIGEAIGGKDVFVRQAVSLAVTSRLVTGTGIANVWSRHARTSHAAAATLADAYPGRFVLGLGIGNPLQAKAVGADYRPLRQLREYLDRMDAPLQDEGRAEVPSPAAPYARILGAVGPKMLALSAERADGAQPFVQPVEHTAAARKILGPDKLLIQPLAVLLADDRAEGMATATVLFERVREVPAYARSWRQLGFSQDAIDTSDPRLVEAIIAVGDADTIAAKVREHLDAGADHVPVLPIVPTPEEAVTQLEKLAPTLLGAL